jgi:hypothetical protein
MWLDVAYWESCDAEILEMQFIIRLLSVLTPPRRIMNYSVSDFRRIVIIANDVCEPVRFPTT